MTIKTFRFQFKTQPRQFSLDFHTERPNHATLKEWLDNGQFYEPDVSNFLLRVLEEGDTVVDVGANLGYFTILAGSLVGETGNIIAFEPDEKNIADIERNLTINGFQKRTNIIRKPAKDCVEQTIFYINSDNSGGNALWDPAEFPGNIKTSEIGEHITLTSTTLDNEIRRLGVSKIKLIKIDTEGAEELVIRGGLQTLIDLQVDFVVTELHTFGLQRLNCTQDSLRKLMHKLGYECYVLGLKGGLPKFIPEGIRIHTPFIPNIVFTKPGNLAKFWEITEIDPREF